MDQIGVPRLDPDVCWEWRGSRSPSGYGRFGDNLYVHRAIYELFVGPIPPGGIVRHACDNPPCFNPWHLLLGSKADNAQDMVDRGRHYSPWDNPGTHATRLRRTERGREVSKRTVISLFIMAKNLDHTGTPLPEKGLVYKSASAFPMPQWPITVPFAADRLTDDEDGED